MKRAVDIVKACVLHNFPLGDPEERQYLADELGEGNYNFDIYHAVELLEVGGKEKRDFVASLL